MAKRVAQKIKNVQGRSAAASKSSGSSTSSNRGGWNFTSFYNKLISAKATPYVAGGIGLAVIARFAYKYYKSHPDMVENLKSNLDSVEEKLSDFTSKVAGKVDSLSEDARH